MYYLDKNADAKWCPFGRIRGANAACNRAASKVGALQSRCVGSNCAAWRWQNANNRQSDDPGYCGLAGAPAPIFEITSTPISK